MLVLLCIHKIKNGGDKMKISINFSLDKAEIPTKDYRRIFASIIKNALSRYMDGQLFEKFYKDTKQKRLYLECNI